MVFVVVLVAIGLFIWWALFPAKPSAETPPTVRGDPRRDGTNYGRMRYRAVLRRMTGYRMGRVKRRF